MPSPLRRLGRRLFWSEPAQYRWLGILRGHGDCLQNDWDVWLGVPFASHFHVPPFIIHGLQLGRPGILLIRPPIDAAVSWTIFWDGQIRLADAPDYYLDFHRALLPFRAELFVATFGQVTQHFSRVIQRFNRHFRTDYASLPSDDASVHRCFCFAEERARSRDGSICELTVSRPSEQRSVMKSNLIESVQASATLVRKLEAANQLYAVFCSNAFDDRPPVPLVGFQHAQPSR